MARPKGSTNKKEKDEEIKSVVEDFNEMINSEDEEALPYTENDLFPSGCTLLNLAMSGLPRGGYSKGKINTLPGGSASGKTATVLTMLAEIANNPNYDEYELIYDDAEAALEFDMVKMFGKKLNNRLKAPRYDKDGNPVNSNTIQEFKNNILHKTSNKIPFIWILDSLDSLSSDEEVEKSYKEAIRDAKSAEHVKELSSGYKLERAKITGEILRIIKKELGQTKSLLIIIQQTRQNINAGLFGKKEITSGGQSPFFYSTHQVWLNKIKTLKDNATKRTIGQIVKADITKNKLNGKKRSVEFLLFDEIGLDNLGSNIDFLVNEGFWKKSGQTIKAKELNIEATRAKLIEEIEKNDLEEVVIDIVADAWNQIEDSLKMNRKKRFE